MNRLIAVTAFFFASASIVGTSRVAFAQQEPQKVGATYSKVYVPVGFDSNDHVQIVGEGIFENACYRPAPTEISVNEATKEITLGPVAYKYQGFCMQVVLPFERTIDVGILKTGTWKVLQKGDGKVIAEIDVKTAQNLAPDDFLYAPVSQAFLRQSKSRVSVFVTGQFPNSCFEMDKMKVTTSDDTIVVQPIAKMNSATDCKEGAFGFQKAVSVPNLKPGRYLLHVRSLNGNAINQLVNVQ